MPITGPHYAGAIVNDAADAIHGLDRKR